MCLQGYSLADTIFFSASSWNKEERGSCGGSSRDDHVTRLLGFISASCIMVWIHHVNTGNPNQSALSFSLTRNCFLFHCSFPSSCFLVGSTSCSQGRPFCCPALRGHLVLLESVWKVLEFRAVKGWSLVTTFLFCFFFFFFNRFLFIKKFQMWITAVVLVNPG